MPSKLQAVNMKASSRDSMVFMPGRQKTCAKRVSIVIYNEGGNGSGLLTGLGMRRLVSLIAQT